MRSAEEIASMMATVTVSPQSQVNQIRFRQAVAKAWAIKPGERILEIGCGQGDMTAVLADIVGSAGHVTALDSASRDYGAPISIGDATDHLKSGPLGSVIDFRLEWDASKPGFESDSYDGVVLALSTWYFPDLGALRKLLSAARLWAPKLYLAEWDLAPTSTDQWAHFLAVNIQGQIESFKSSSFANVRTPYSRQNLESFLPETGWQIAKVETINASDLDDGRWEVEQCLRHSPGDIDQIAAPEKFKAFLRGQLDLLASYAQRSRIQPLPAYAASASRA